MLPIQSSGSSIFSSRFLPPIDFIVVIGCGLDNWISTSWQEIKCIQPIEVWYYLIWSEEIVSRVTTLWYLWHSAVSWAMWAYHSILICCLRSNLKDLSEPVLVTFFNQNRFGGHLKPILWKRLFVSFFNNPLISRHLGAREECQVWGLWLE